jgi:transketolase
MRKEFAIQLHKEMKTNKNIIVLVGDVGYGMFDKIKEDFPDRFFNTGAAEQTMIDIAIGIALSGKIPVVYTITPFLLFRGFDGIRNYINHESIPVKLIGSGRDNDYSNNGFSHSAEDDYIIENNFKNIICQKPETKDEIKYIINTLLTNGKPVYLNLRR